MPGRTSIVALVFSYLKALNQLLTAPVLDGIRRFLGRLLDPFPDLTFLLNITFHRLRTDSLVGLFCHFLNNSFHILRIKLKIVIYLLLLLIAINRGSPTTRLII